jgi:hypothetical protein
MSAAGLGDRGLGEAEIQRLSLEMEAQLLWG